MLRALSALALGVILVPATAHADIITVNKPGSHTVTIVSVPSQRCSDQPLILHVGKPDRPERCAVEVRRTVAYNKTEITVVVLAHGRNGHYRHHRKFGYGGPRD